MSETSDTNLHDSCFHGQGCCSDRESCGPVFRQDDVLVEAEPTSEEDQEIVTDTSEQGESSPRGTLNLPETAGKVAIGGTQNFLPELSGPNFPITEEKKWF